MKIEKINNYSTSFNGGFTQRAEAEIKNMLTRNVKEQGMRALEDNAKLLNTVFQIRQNPKNYLIDLNMVSDSTKYKSSRKLINISADRYVDKIRFTSDFSPVTLCEYYSIGNSKTLKPAMYYNTDFIKQLSVVLNKFGKNETSENIRQIKYYKCRRTNKEESEYCNKIKARYLDFLKDLVQKRWGSKCVENNTSEKSLIEWLFK